LKDYLINKTFRNFSNECFDSVYKNSGNVTWKISNQEVLDNFLKIPDIDNKIETVSMEYNLSENFSFNFRFKK